MPTYWLSYFPWLGDAPSFGGPFVETKAGRPGVAKRRKSRKAQRVARRVGRHA